ncbi:MAG: hypothetical protein JNM93_14015 [Bacteriovoracaceae bacterium]|nr:hypothetical protein [Bacteriovoracaceae bacterium]
MVIRLLFTLTLGLLSFASSAQNTHQPELEFLNTYLTLVPQGLNSTERYGGDIFLKLQKMFQLEEQLTTEFSDKRNFMEIAPGIAFDKIDIRTTGTHEKKTIEQKVLIMQRLHDAWNTQFSDIKTKEFIIEGLTTGLILTFIPNDKQKQILEADINERISQLNYFLPALVNFQETGFNFELYSLPPQINKDDFIKQLQIQASYEIRLIGTIRTEAIHAERTPHNRALIEEDLDTIRDLHIYKKHTKSLELSEKTLAYARKKLLKQMQAFYETTTMTIDHENSHLSLLHVPARLAALRGCVGKDCSTSNSFSFAYDPNEMTFYIYPHFKNLNEIPEPLGHATGTWLESEGQKHFYLHTVNGTTLTTAQTYLIASGIEKWVKEQQAEAKLLLPSETNLASNINYSTITSALKSMLDRENAISVKHTNPELRSLFEKITPSIYDSMANNKKAYIVLTPHLLEIALQTEMFEKIPARPLDALAKIRIYKSFGSRILENDLYYQFVKNVLPNDTCLNVDEYHREMKEFFAKEGINYNRSYYLKKIDLFYPAIIFSPDNFSEQNKATTIKDLFTYLKSSTLEIDMNDEEPNFDGMTSAEIANYNMWHRQKNSFVSKIADAIEFKTYALIFLKTAKRQSLLHFLKFMGLVSIKEEIDPDIMSAIFKKIDLLEGGDFTEYIIPLFNYRNTPTFQNYLIEAIKRSIEKNANPEQFQITILNQLLKYNTLPDLTKVLETIISYVTTTEAPVEHLEKKLYDTFLTKAYFKKQTTLFHNLFEHKLSKGNIKNLHFAYDPTQIAIQAELMFTKYADLKREGYKNERRMTYRTFLINARPNKENISLLKKMLNQLIKSEKDVAYFDYFAWGYNWFDAENGEILKTLLDKIIKLDNSELIKATITGYFQARFNKTVSKNEREIFNSYFQKILKDKKTDEFIYEIYKSSFHARIYLHKLKKFTPELESFENLITLIKTGDKDNYAKTTELFQDILNISRNEGYFTLDEDIQSLINILAASYKHNMHKNIISKMYTNLLLDAFTHKKHSELITNKMIDELIHFQQYSALALLYNIQPETPRSEITQQKIYNFLLNSGKTSLISTNVQCNKYLE